jgi:hypothetical protein
MHSNKISVIIGLLYLTINIGLLIIYSHYQAKYTFEFVKSLYAKFF